MAVEDKYVDTAVAGGKLAKALKSSGSEVYAIVVTFEIAAADDDGSVYRLVKNMAPDLVPVQITLMCDAITGGTDFDLGFYKTNNGAEVDKDCLMDGQTLASASRTIDGLQTVGIEEFEKMIYEHAGHSVAQRLQGYDLCLTANTVGTAAGTVTMVAFFAQG